MGRHMSMEASTRPWKPFVVDATLLLVKLVAIIHDILTFPVYLALQKPWKYWKRRKICFAKPAIDNDPSSPYRRVQNLEVDSLRDIETLDDLARKAIRTNAQRPALGTRRVLGRREENQENGKVFKKLVLGDYEWMTYEEVDRKIDLTARGLLSIGVKPGEHLAIFAETRAEWLITAQACFRTNIPLVTVYATLSNDGIVSAINETEVTHIVTSLDLLPRLLSVIEKVPSLTHIVCMANSDAEPPVSSGRGPQVISFSSLQQLGSEYDQLSAPTADDVAIVMFTSGSSGKPKGVVVTHRNIISGIKGSSAIWERYGIYNNEAAYIAYLPLAHMLELFAEVVAFSAGARIGYSSALTLTDNSSALARGCTGDIRLLQPTVLACVPLILDRLHKGVTDVSAAKGPLFSALFDFAISYKTFWLNSGFSTPVLDMLVFNKARILLGGNLKVLLCGSAPLSIYTRHFVRACFGCRVIEGYGMTETSGPATLMDPDDTTADRVGAPIPGFSIRLIDWPEGNYSTSDKPHPRGEIIVGAAAVAKGYFKNYELTRESFEDKDGIHWIYTGDIGEMFPDGTLKIVDRKKDLIKLQFGEYISLGRVESILKTCPLVDNVLVYGNSLHTYLVAFVSPNYDKLLRLYQDLGGNDAASLTELCEDAKVAKAAEQAIMAHARERGLEKAEVPRRVKLCAEDWTPDSGLVTATFKIRRKPMQTFYQRDIEELYCVGTESRLKQA
ncbi:fatty acid CoA ligase Acsl3-like [Haemaphysalis longicornis]